MIDPIDSDNDSDHQDNSRYLEFIDLVVDKSIKRVKSKSYRPKIQDALRAIRLKQKVFKDSKSEKTFWGMIEELRHEELPKMFPESKPEPVDLESQIINTIKRLKYQVTNGTLPVNTITDYFNYHKPNESRLSYSRLGRILSAMGFRKTRISNGRSAIFWDDQLLSNGFGVQKLASADSSPEVQPDCGSLSERSGNPVLHIDQDGERSRTTEGGASASNSLSKRSEITAESGASANNAPSQAAPESCQTDPLDLRYTLPPPKSLPKEIISSDSNSSVSNVCNSLPDSGLKGK